MRMGPHSQVYVYSHTYIHMYTCVRMGPHSQVYVVEGTDGKGPRLQTDGVNFEGAWDHDDLADVAGITTNDVHAMLVT